jgi:hypothetical protein
LENFELKNRQQCRRWLGKPAALGGKLLTKCMLTLKFNRLKRRDIFIFHPDEKRTGCVVSYGNLLLIGSGDNNEV